LQAAAVVVQVPALAQALAVQVVAVQVVQTDLLELLIPEAVAEVRRTHQTTETVALAALA
jgi:hypothetical protein